MAHLPLCLGRRAAALPAGRGWDAEAVPMFVLLILAILLLPLQTALCPPSAAASAEQGKQLSPVLLCIRRGEFTGFTENAFAVWWSPKRMVSYPCCRTWLNLVYAFEKLLTGTSLACRSELEQQVLTTGFPLMLMPLWFAGFGCCFCLPALRRSPQHTEPSCDFHRCVGGHAVGFSSCFNFFTNVSVLARCKLTVGVVSWDHNSTGELTSCPLNPVK